METTLIEKEQLLIDKIINLLKTKPEFFTAKWFSGKAIDNSLQSIDKNILIMNTGEIIQPINPKVSDEQKEILKELMQPIFDRDKNELLDNFLAT